jgi:hypothetical protein
MCSRGGVRGKLSKSKSKTRLIYAQNEAQVNTIAVGFSYRSNSRKIRINIDKIRAVFITRYVSPSATHAQREVWCYVT